ncbi:Metallo-dependent phosphatase [Rozella allomycis CSF55]|uniref:Metallo-dependent phosphatase n=1 Tax=Rozella allomycis (strain CSF55) TaxID=988480 RepID=A0A4P9YNY8_ROZAC|nr:Metallo-dependent phosphatase [Rozella allomycis CSF55]
MIMGTLVTRIKPLETSVKARVKNFKRWICSTTKPINLQFSNITHFYIHWESNCHSGPFTAKVESEKQFINVNVLSEELEGGFTHYFFYVPQALLQSDSILSISDQSEKVIQKQTFDITRAETFRVGFIADNQFIYSKFYKICRLLSSKKPNVIIHGGDSIQDYWKMHQWSTDYYSPILHASKDLFKIPWAMVLGNHEATSSFVPPYHHENRWYSFSQRNAYFIVLDSNRQSDKRQYEWFIQEISSITFKKATFRVVIVHIPPFIEYWEPEAWNRGESEWNRILREKYVPLFVKSRVDIVLSGHQHNYQRGKRNGVTYFIAGGAGGDLDTQKVHDWNMYEKTLLDHHFLILDIYANKLTITTYDINNRIVDEVKIEK